MRRWDPALGRRPCYECYTRAMNPFIIVVAKYAFLLSIALAVVRVWKTTSPVRTRILKFSLISLPLGYVFTKLAGMLWYDPRPFVSDHIVPLIAHAPDNGFPSDHTVLTMTIACIIFLYHRRTGYVLFFIAAAIGVARVLSGLHHTADILGSVVIAILATAVAVVITKRVAWFSV